MRFLPQEKRKLMELMSRLYDGLDVAQRRDLAEYCEKMLKDGKIGTTEWSQFGKKVGAFRLGK